MASMGSGEEGMAHKRPEISSGEEIFFQEDG